MVESEAPETVEHLLTPTELTALADLRAEMAAETAGPDGWWLTDACLCRYLRARNWAIPKAAKMLRASLRWREKFRPESITWEEVKAEALTGKMYVSNSKDRSGRTILVMRPSKENTKQREGQMKHLVYCLESALRKAALSDEGRGVARGSGVELVPEQLCIVIDYAGWSLYNAPSAKTSKETLGILLDQYPERLGCALLLNPPKVFSVFWKMISPFIDKRTGAKIKMINTNSTKGADELAESIAGQALSDDVPGGPCTVVFDVEEYGMKMQALEPPRES